MFFSLSTILLLPFLLNATRRNAIAMSLPASQSPTDISVALKGQSTLNTLKQALTIASISATDETLEDGEETV